MQLFNSRYTFLCLLGLAVCLGACKKQLNVLPTTQEVDGNIIVDTRSAGIALNGVYYQFAASGTDVNGIPSTRWVDYNEGMPSELSGLFTYPGGTSLSDLASHNYVSTSAYAAAMWSYGYAIVNAANGFLKNLAPVGNIDDSTKREMVAEAKFLRAYANAYLLMYFGLYSDTTSPEGIILRDQFVSVNDLSLPRSTVAQSYDSIASDIDNAIPYLPGVNTTKAAANVWAAKLLMARVSINRGGAADYASVISLTNDIIQHSPYSLEPEVMDIFWSKAFNSNEVIMGVQPFTAPQQSYKYYSYFQERNYVLTDSAVSFFQGDPREHRIYYKTTLPTVGVKPLFIKYYPGDTVSTAPVPLLEYSYAFRLTEAYLLQAEALAASGGDLNTAKSLLKTVMGHAGYSDFSAVDGETTAEGVRELVIGEEMKNFIGESGQDWLAARRLPFAVLQAWIPTLVSSTLLILPIPTTETYYNSQIKQNFGY